MNNNQDNQNINPLTNNLNNPNLSNSRFYNIQNGFVQNQKTPLNVIPQMQPQNLGINNNEGFINNQQVNIMNNSLSQAYTNNSNITNNGFNNNTNGFVADQQDMVSQTQSQKLENNINQATMQQNNVIIPNQDNINNQNNNFFNTGIKNNYNNLQYNNNLNNNDNFNNNINNEITMDSILNNEEINAFQNQNKFITENQTNTTLNDLNIEGDYNGLPKVDYSRDPKVIENIKAEKKKNTITITGEAKVFIIIIAVLLIFTFIMPTIFDFIRDIQY